MSDKDLIIRLLEAAERRIRRNRILQDCAKGLAAALLKRDIPASDKTTSLGSYPLYGRLVQSRPRDSPGLAGFTGDYAPACARQP